MGNRVSTLWCKKVNYAATDVDKKHNSLTRGEKRKKSGLFRTLSQRLRGQHASSKRSKQTTTTTTNCDNAERENLTYSVERQFAQLNNGNTITQETIGENPSDCVKMTDIPESTYQSGMGSPTPSLIENFHKKNASNVVGVGSPTPALTDVSGFSGSNSNLAANSAVSSIGRHLNTSASSSSSLKGTSTSQQVVNSTTTRVEKKSQRLHHIRSSSTSTSTSATATATSTSSASSAMRQSAVKRDLNEIKNSMSEINDLAMGRNAIVGNTANSGNTLATHTHSINDLSKLNALNSSDAINQLKMKIRSSIEDLVDDHAEPMVTLPESDDDLHHGIGSCLELVNASKNAPLSELNVNGSSCTGLDTVKFQEKRTKTESKTKVITDGFSSEQATSNLAEMKHLQTGDIDYKEAKAAAAMRNRLEVDGVKAESNAAVIQEALSLRTGDVTQQASNNVEAASISVQSDTFSADKKAISQSQQSQTMTSNGIISQEKHVSSASQSNYTMTHKSVSSSGSSMIQSSSTQVSTNGALFKLADLKLDDLKALSSSSVQRDIDQAIAKYSNVLNSFVNTLQDTKAPTPEKSLYLDKINEVMRRAWAVPTHGHELGYSLCNSLRKSGGLDLLMKNCVQSDMRMKFSSAQLLEQCLTTENRTHVVENGLDKVVNVACVCMKNPNTEHSRVGTGILEHLFKHSEGTCSDVIKLGGLDAVLFECRTNDVETLRHCASALANLSLYGGAENQEAMIYRKVPMWLFPLAFHDDDNIKYYACLAIAVLVANKEIEAEVLKSGCLDLVEPFVTSHDPSEFAKSNLAHAHGQSKHWLQRLVPVLSSNREEARNLAAFHFCMEAGIKAEQGNRGIFHDIGAIEALKTVASCPNAIASKFAAQALRLIGEVVPHKLSQQVPLWSVEDVQEWVKQIGFGQFEAQFKESQVDGDLLLKLNEDNLRDDIGISNGILLKRFERELQNLKRMADYSSKDNAKLYHFLIKIGSEYCAYTYAMLNAGLDINSLPQLNEDMLIAECGIKNMIHRLRILNAVKNLENQLPSSSEENMAKTLDVFVSYRRSNGSQLASLLKVHLQLRGFSVFIDVERLEAGKFDNGLLNSIVKAKNFLLVLTPNALERCVDDCDGKDWVHREIVAALNANCNIIPIIDQQFMWPETERLPEDMRTISHFNGVQWIHDYQDACIDKLERFMRGEKNVERYMSMTPSTPGTAPVTYQRMHSNESDYSNGGTSVNNSVAVSSNGSNNNNSNSNNNGVNNANGNVVGQANHHQANKYRKSSSPARQHDANNNTLGHGFLSANQLNMYGRNSRRNLLPPYRTQQAPAQAVHKLRAVGGSMQNMSPLAYALPPRRSSATTAAHVPNSNSNSTLALYSQPVQKLRSHSVEGLLYDTNNNNNNNNNDNNNNNNINDETDTRIAQVAALVAAGSNALTNASCSSTNTLQPQLSDSLSSLGETDATAIATVVARRESHAAAVNAHHRKSRSLDHIFVETQPEMILCAAAMPTEGTQSMQNLLLTPPITVEGNGSGVLGGAACAHRGVRTQPFPPRANVQRHSPEGVSSTEDEQDEKISSTNNNQNKSKIIAKNNQQHQQLRTTAAPQQRAAASAHRSSQLRAPTAAAANGTTSAQFCAPQANNQTIFNRTMKKVRSLIKK